MRVRDEEESALLDRDELQQIFLKLAAGLFVDGGEGLVHQQHVGPHRQGARQAHPLAHAARELMRIFPFEAAQSDFADIFLGDGFALGGRNAAQLEAEGDVADDARPGQQREILEHEGALGPGPSTFLPLTSTVPAAGFSRPAMILSNVVLPQPEGPSSDVSSPAGKSRSISFSACTGPG
jgi:hypothetical protein